MLQPNTLLQNRYLIERKLGQGGMGAVYLANDTRFDTSVALKQTLVRDENLRKAFEREARLLNKLRHAALPHVIDYFGEGENEFLVMQYIPGDDLAALLEKNGQPFATEQVLRWADQILAALEYLHAYEPPIVHRDIKPQNLKQTPQGEIVLLDFGLSKGSAVDLSQAAGGASVAGYTPHFAPLEQIRGAGTNPRSDLYSLAATLYLLLTGSMPPDALERASAMLGNRPDPLRPVSEVNPRVPVSVSQVLQGALSQAPENRWPSATAMRAALREAGGDAARTTPFRSPTTVPDRPPVSVPRPPSAPSGAPPMQQSSQGGFQSGPGMFQSPSPPSWQSPHAAAPAPYPQPPHSAPPSQPQSFGHVPSVPSQQPPKSGGLLKGSLLALWLTFGLVISFVAGLLVEVFLALAMGEEDPSGKLTLLLTLVIYVAGAVVFIFLVRR